MTVYPIPAQRLRVRHEISKSRFLTTVGHTPTITAAKTFIDTLKAEFSDASHNCWAYNTGPPHVSAQVGMSDDGEPHGTAGKPILNVLLHSPVGECCVVVTRYFGGIRLGKGGLIRAYSGCAKAALEQLLLIEKIPRTACDIIVSYPLWDEVQRLLSAYDTLLDEPSFSDCVRCRIEVAQHRYAELQSQLKRLAIELHHER